MSWIITLIIWIIIGILSFLSCLVGVAPIWGVFWCTYGALIINMLENIFNYFNNRK